MDDSNWTPSPWHRQVVMAVLVGLVMGCVTGAGLLRLEADMADGRLLDAAAAMALAGLAMIALSFTPLATQRFALTGPLMGIALACQGLGMATVAWVTV